MVPERFDTLVQSLGMPGSRRRLLGRMASGLLAILVGASAAEAHVHAPEQGGTTGAAQSCKDLIAPGPDRGRCISDVARGCGGDLCATEGLMQCCGTGFVTCDQGTFVYRDCGPGTRCFPRTGGSVICDFPRNP
jgi:hypothetical protein